MAIRGLRLVCECEEEFTIITGLSQNPLAGVLSGADNKRDWHGKGGHGKGGTEKVILKIAVNLYASLFLGPIHAGFPHPPEISASPAGLPHPPEIFRIPRSLSASPGGFPHPPENFCIPRRISAFPGDFPASPRDFLNPPEIFRLPC